MFNEHHDVDSHENTHDPILVLGRHGDEVWCGGPVPLRAVLNLLSDGIGAVEVSNAHRCWQRAGGKPALFPEMLFAYGHLLSAGTGLIRLRISPSAVQRTIERAVSQVLEEVINHGGKGVDRGIFRAPTLRLTSRWIYVEKFLAGTIGVQLAAFVLAGKVGATLQGSAHSEEPTAIFQVRSVPSQLTQYLSESLRLTGRYYSQPAELSIGEPPVGEQVPKGAKVVLCADIIRSEDTVRQAVANVAGRDADPLIIACLVDARDNHGPVRLLNRTIRVVSLTEVNIAVKWPEGQVTEIDPVTLRPVAPARAWAESAQGRDLLTSFGRALDMLRLGHVDGPPHRHYSAFVNINALLQGETRDRITDAVLSNVEDALTDLRAQANQEAVMENPIAIWYVASDDDSETLVELVKIIRRSLAKKRIVVSIVTPIPRVATGHTWEFPATISNVSEPTTLVIIHSWASTGSTLQQLVRLGAESGFSSIAAVCMLNQMDAKNAQFMRMLRAVSVAPIATVGAPSVADSASTVGIPVAIRFVAASGIVAFDTNGCPICATQKRYQLDEEAAPPRLIRHAKQLCEMLRLREWKDVARDPPRDLFTVPVTDQEARDYLRWRRLLLRALRNVGDREEVMDRLRALTGQTPPEPEWTGIGLIRLLAAEQQWLWLPPLRFRIAAELLSQVYASCLEQAGARTWLRVQVLMVMSAAVPYPSVALLPRLLQLAADDAVLIDQMLLDCRRLLLRTPGDSPIDVAQLRHNLLVCRDYLERKRTDSAATLTEEHLISVRRLLTDADYVLLPKPADEQAAWERLREDLVRPVVRHSFEPDLLLVRSFVEDIEAVEPSPEEVREANRQWGTCVQQLQERVLVNLPPLLEILSGDFVSDLLGRREQTRLVSLTRSGVGELGMMTDRLHALAQGPWRPTDPAWKALRRELLDQINWWNRMFLTTHATDNTRALLVELIGSAPARPQWCVKKLLKAKQEQATIRTPENGQVDVFCPERLLDQILAHLLENVEKHRVKNAFCQLEIEHLRPDRGIVQMVVRNSGTAPSAQPGHGLKALSDKLRPFGGKLTGQDLAEGEWTFAAVATLPLWRGG
jgi:adenine/guanine phosphoribosyltransferase-like PRPP-binding protein